MYAIRSYYALAKEDKDQDALKLTTGPARDLALEGVRRESEVGSRTVLDVLDAEQELLNARVNLVRAQRNEALASYQVLSALGRLTAGDLDLDTPVYDPKVHYDEASGKWIGGGVFSDDGTEAMRPAR